MTVTSTQAAVRRHLLTGVRSAQQGFTSSTRSAQQGFTLIELLVAVMIFAMLTLAGVALLRGSVSAQSSVRTALEGLNGVQRARAIIDADLAQATVRVTRGENGLYAPAFFGRSAGADEPVLQFVRMGWSNPDGAARPTLQKVEYWWRDGALQRVGYDRLDGARAQEPATIIEDVGVLAMRYRDERGDWRETWSPRRPDELPRAVEMTLTIDGQAPLRMVFPVGPGGPDDATLLAAQAANASVP